MVKLTDAEKAEMCSELQPFIKAAEAIKSHTGEFKQYQRYLKGNHITN